MFAENVVLLQAIRRMIEDVALDSDVKEKMTKSSYLGEVLSSEGRGQEAVIARIRSGWKKYKNIARVLCKRFVSLKLRESLYKS